MINKRTDIDNEYPLVKFIYGSNLVTVYDARTHFAINLHLDDVESFQSLMVGGGGNFVHMAPSCRVDMELLRQSGVFAHGIFDETYVTDPFLLCEVVAHQISNVVTRKFCLEVTEYCNFRCTYCPYTVGMFGRRHSFRSMDFMTAKVAIDMYFKRYVSMLSSVGRESVERIIEKAPPNLGWYGGEPLFNFEVIKKSYEYFVNLPWGHFGIGKQQLRFTLNTNLSMLTDEMMMFVIHNDVFVYVSLDGPREDNDLHRVFVGGSGTFDVVYGNLLKIVGEDAEFCRNNITILSTVCRDHDLDRCRDFIDSIGLMSIVSDVQVPGMFLDIDSVADNDILKRKLFVVEDAVALGSEGFVREFERYGFLYDVVRNLNSSLFDVRVELPFQRTGVFPFGMRTCPMGTDQLMVSVDGHYHMCQKTDASFPLGVCNGGYNVGSMTLAYEKLHLALNDHRCRSCWAIRFCGICAAPMLREGSFIIPSEDECKAIRRDAEFQFKLFQLVSEDINIVDYLGRRANSGVVDISII